MALKNLGPSPTFGEFLLARKLGATFGRDGDVKELSKFDWSSPKFPKLGIITFPPGPNGQGPAGRRSMVVSYFDYLAWCARTGREAVSGPEAVWL